MRALNCSNNSFVLPKKVKAKFFAKYMHSYKWLKGAYDWSIPGFDPQWPHLSNRKISLPSTRQRQSFWTHLPGFKMTNRSWKLVNKRKKRRRRKRRKKDFVSTIFGSEFTIKGRRTSLDIDSGFKSLDLLLVDGPHGSKS